FAAAKTRERQKCASRNSNRRGKQYRCEADKERQAHDRPQCGVGSQHQFKSGCFASHQNSGTFRLIAHLCIQSRYGQSLKKRHTYAYQNMQSEFGRVAGSRVRADWPRIYCASLASRPTPKNAKNKETWLKARPSKSRAF